MIRGRSNMAEAGTADLSVATPIAILTAIEHWSVAASLVEFAGRIRFSSGTMTSTVR